MSDIPKRTKTTWVTAAGREIEVSELEDSHLSNIIHLIHRKAWQIRSAFRFFPHVDPDGASADQAVQAFLDGIKTYKALRKEFQYRELGVPGPLPFGRMSVSGATR